MAGATTIGLEELILDLEKLAALPDSVKSEMLTAAGEIVRDETKARAPVDTGTLRDSIKARKPTITPDGGSVLIVPTGNRKRGNTTTGNMEIAFVTENGKRGKAARPFMREAAEASHKDAAEAAQKIYNDYLTSLNL